LDYTNWRAGEPNNNQSASAATGASGENCVTMYPEGDWNDLDCSWLKSSACKMAAMG
jgi:hypothetical protein